MKNMLLALSCVGIFTVSCGSKDDKGGSSGPNAEKPSLELVGASDFKNTAKSGKEVGAKFQEVGKSAAEVKFSQNSRKNSSGSNHENVLALTSVRSFLGDITIEDQDTPGSAPSKNSFNLDAGSDCASSLKFLDQTFAETSNALVSAAKQLDEVDGAQLQDGITRNPPNDQYAVSFTIDLAKVKSEEGDQSNRGSMNTTGQAQIGAGANDKMAVLAVGIDAAGSDESMSGTVKGGFVVSADNAQKLIRLAANAAANMNVQDQNGKTQNAHGTLTTDIRLQAGANPSIGFTLSGNGNAVPSKEGNMAVSNSDHSFGADFKIEKLANNDVAVTYKILQDGKTEGSKVTFTNDANGQCVVKGSAAPSIKTAL